MATMTNRPRLTSAQFLIAHRRALETISGLYEAMEEIPVLAANNPASMKELFDELVSVRIAAEKLAQHLRTNDCTKENFSSSF